MTEFNEIAKKWQKAWEEKGIFKVTEDPKKKKCYVLEMYPYPSASYLHMGHVRNYTIGDVYARFKRMNGFNVLYPMGYDSFGLPAETAAKKEGIHPEEYTKKAIAQIMKYQKALGNSYDWDRVLSSHDPDYYRWNQFFFIQLFNKGLAYRKKAPVNWCPNCQSVLANEEAEGGQCWRCDSEVVKKDLDQWFFKITDYADRLLDDLDKIEWPEKIKTMQQNWIGKSEGVNIFFLLEGSKQVLPAFTTRCDTIFSVTFIAIAPENPLVAELTKGTKYEQPVREFVDRVVKEQIEDRINEDKEKEGIFIGKYAINPSTNERIPVYVANFAVMYGTGIVMCDAHDKRDFRFARKYNIPLRFVISPDGKPIDPSDFDDAFIDDGILFGSGKFSGMKNTEALPQMADWLAESKMGEIALNYKIKDWLISRQRYWGTPIPMVHCPKCGAVPVPESQLPVLLPKEVDFSSANPLRTNEKFLHTTCPKCKGNATRETDTMGGFVDSSWYFLRYCDNKNKKEPFNKKNVKYWMPVDQYIGGAEHAVMHLMYARFFVKALKDMGFVDFDEPFAKLFNQGIVYKDGNKMSKSKGNVVYQTDISDKYGIDTARVFLMFIASPDKTIEWSDEGVEGSFRFMKRFYALVEKKITPTKDVRQESKIHKTIRDVTQQIEDFKFNLALITLMEMTNYLSSKDAVNKTVIEALIRLMAPFAPHTCEEMWESLGNKPFVSLAAWPSFDASKIDEEAEFQESMVAAVADDITAVMQLAKIEKPSKVTIVVAESWTFAFMKKLKETMQLTRSMSDLIKATMQKGHEKDIAPLVQKLLKNESKIPKAVLTQEKEIAAIVANKNGLADQFGCSVDILAAESSKEPKAKQALPGKPAILVS